jgi:FkbM family methyltransferase
VSVKKMVRTAQSHFWFLKEAKDEFYITYRRLMRVPSEPFFKALPIIRRHFNGCYVDVGGNIGQSIEAIRLFVPDARIISFEPNPNLANKLTRRYRRQPKVEIRAIGLSDHNAMLKLYVPSYRGFVYDGLGSLDSVSASSWICPDTIYFFRADRLEINEHECAVEPLDAQGLVNPIFIKIDVEGTEYAVIKGGVGTIRKYERILLVEGFHEKPELAALTASLGYEPYTFNGRNFLAGASETSSFLMTRARKDVIQS